MADTEPKTEAAGSSAETAVHVGLGAVAGVAGAAVLVAAAPVLLPVAAVGAGIAAVAAVLPVAGGALGALAGWKWGKKK
jgi:hypothetical protein